MITGDLRNQIDQIWNAFWSGGISNPLEVIEQITYLLFLRRLDELQLLEERKATRLKRPMERRIFPEGLDPKERPYEDLRWSRFKNFAPAEMYTVVSEHVFPFLRTLGGTDSTYAQHMKDARFTIPTPALLTKVVDLVAQVPLDDRDTQGDLYEYMLGKIATAGQNGQFRTPRHIIQLMVELAAPTPKDVICDPASGTCGFLVGAGEYLRAKHPEIFRDDKLREHFHNHMFHGFDFDNTMLRIGSMNMLLHGVENPDIRYRDSLSQDNAGEEERYSLILANPPFAGSLDYESCAKDLLNVVKTKKTELLFLALFLRLLKPGGRAAVIVPEGVLFGSSTAHKKLRQALVEEQKLEAVIKLPSGTFKPYSGVSTAILVFTKSNSGGTDHVWFYDVQADGWSLDDKRIPLLPEEKLGPVPVIQLSTAEHEKNNLPDVRTRWLNRHDGERNRPRTAQSFCVSKVDIVAQGYNLSMTPYKEVDHSAAEHRSPEVILTNLAQLEGEIQRGLHDLGTLISLQGLDSLGRYPLAPLAGVAEVVSGVTKGRDFGGKETIEVPYLRVANVQAGFLDLTELKTIEVLTHEVEELRLLPGDVVLTEGGDFDKLGRGALWEGQVDPCIHQNHVFRVRVNPDFLDSRFFNYYLQTDAARAYFMRCAKRTTNLASINMTQLRALSVPLPPLSLQREYAQRMARVEKLKAAQRASLVELDALFASLQHRAFRGEL